MKVQELIDALKEEDQDAEVRIMLHPSTEVVILGAYPDDVIPKLIWLDIEPTGDFP